MIPLFYPFIKKPAILREIKDTLDGRWLGQGPKVDRFEQMFAEKMNYRRALFVNSGTSALELAYHILGLKEGDEVIVPVLNCTAGQMGLLRRGVKIVFADVDENLNIDPKDVRTKIRAGKTKAIVGVHLGGIEYDDDILTIGKQYDIPIITDAAQHMVNTKGDFICYSFQAIKHITTCDGGMLVCRKEEDHDRAKLLRWFGIDREAKEKNGYQAWKHRQMTFDIIEPGFKFQPTDIDACFGLAMLPHLDKAIRYREELAKCYIDYLDPNVRVIAGGSYWLFGILTDYRDDLAEYLLKNDVDNNMVHLRNDIFQVFGGKRGHLPMMNELESRYLYLPLNHKVTPKDVRFIANLVNTFLSKKRAESKRDAINEEFNIPKK